MRCMSVLALTWGCSGESTSSLTEPTNPDVVEPEPPSVYIYEEEAPPQPEAALADVNVALQSALDATLSINAAPVLAAYDEVMAASSATCPYFYNTQDGTYWLDSCVAPSGAQFDGYVSAFTIEDQLDPESGALFSLSYAFGGATVVDDLGNMLEIGGAAGLQTQFLEFGEIDVYIYTTQLQGAFSWDGASAAGTWLETDIAPDLTVQITDAIDFGFSTGVTGGFGGLDGWAVAYDNNTIFSATFGSSCPEELSGTVGVRSPDGHWYDVRFDGPVSEKSPPVPAADCDGCGTVYFQGVEMGQSCVDFSGLTTWEDSPW
ncbi:MAG: hypothetical protein KTR31_01960 [Myxococcales bacterium]|nr:hypothetical protein [Myxococcales bacterium]